MTASPTLVAGRYRLIEPLGVGGMGRVWHAWDQTLGRDVAVKEIVPPEHLLATERDELRRRTLREARAAARLNHPNVVRVYDVFETNGRPWIVMEFVQARSLHDVLTSDGPVDPVRAATIGLGVLGALRAAHRAGVMHRDVKPSNVLLSSDGRVVLTDFGIATLEGDPGVTRPGLVLGSPAYISPERARDGTAGPESDLWSLGATLYAAVEGRAPFERNSAIATLTALASEEVEPPRNAGALRWVLNGLLRKDPEARIDAAEAERRLHRAAAAGPSGARRFRWPWTKQSGTAYRPPRQGSQPVDGPVSPGPVGGGPVAGRPVSGGPVAGRSVSGGPVAGRPVSGGPVAGRPVSGGPVAGRPLSGGPVAGGRPGAGPTGAGPVARGRASAGPVAAGPVAGGPPTGGTGARSRGAHPDDARSNRDHPEGARAEGARSEGARSHPLRSDGARTGPVRSRSDGARSGTERSDGARSIPPGTAGVQGMGPIGSRPRGTAAVPPAPASPATPTSAPRASEPTAHVPTARTPAARGSAVPGSAMRTSPAEGPVSPAAGATPPEALATPPGALATPPAALAAPTDTTAAPRPVPAPAPAESGGAAAASPRSAPPSWPVPRFDQILERATPKPAPAVPVQRPAVEDVKPAVPAAEETDADAERPAEASTATDTAVDSVPTKPEPDVEATTGSDAVAEAAVDVTAPASATTAEAVPDESGVSEVAAGPATAGVAESDPAGTADASAEPGGDAVVPPPVEPAGGRAAKGRKGRNRKGKGRRVEATQPAAPLAEAPAAEDRGSEDRGSEGGGHEASGAMPGTGEDTATGVPGVRDTESRAAVAKESGSEDEPGSVESKTAGASPEVATPKVGAVEDAESAVAGSEDAGSEDAGSEDAGSEDGHSGGAPVEAARSKAADVDGAAGSDAQSVDAQSVDAQPEHAQPEDPQHEAPQSEAPQPEAPRSGDRRSEGRRSRDAASAVAGSVGVTATGEPGTRAFTDRASTDRDVTTVVAPGLALLGKGAAARPRPPRSESAESPATTIVVPGGSNRTAERVRGLASVVRSAPGAGGTDERRKRIFVLTAAVLILLVAVVFTATRNTDGERSPRGQVDGQASQGATSAAASPTGASPGASEPAAPPSVAPSETSTAAPGGTRPELPAGWREHNDPTGFSVYVPAHWQPSRRNGMVYFEGDGRTLGIDQTNEPKSDPVADWRGQRDYRLSRNHFPGYVEIRIEAVNYFQKAADWEFTYNEGGGRTHVSNRGVVVGPRKAYGFWWQTADGDWAAAAPVLELVYASFRPDPAAVGS